MNTQILSFFQVFQTFSGKCKSSFLQSCPKEYIRYHCECIVNLLKGNLQSIKRHHVTKFQNEVRLLSLQRITRQKKGKFWHPKTVTNHEKLYLPINNHLSWYAADYSRPCFCEKQQVFEYSGSYKTRASKVSTQQKPKYPIVSIKKK